MKSNEKYENPVYFLNFTLSNERNMRKMEKANAGAWHMAAAFSILFWRTIVSMAKQSFKPGNMLYPLPAVMVSCQRPQEAPNIITVAWVGTVCSEPAMLSISVKKERYSHNILKDTNEFVVNLVTKDLVRATDYCGVRSGRDVDKFKETNLTPVSSCRIHAPGIKESPVNLECQVKQVIELGSHDMFLA